jgi:hypothetical protein
MVTEKVFKVPNKPVLDWYGVEKQACGFCKGVLLFDVREPSHVDGVWLSFFKKVKEPGYWAY